MTNKNQFVALLDRVSEEEKVKHDFQVYLKDLRMTNECNLVSVQKMDVSAGSELSDFALTQLFNHVEMPVKYMKKLKLERPELVAEQFNYLVSSNSTLKNDKEKKILLRSIQTPETTFMVRGVLSDRYTILDNAQILDSLVNVVNNLPDFKVESLLLNDKKMHIRLSFNDIFHNFGQSPEGKDDIVKVGLDIQNSEIGYSSLVVSPITYRLVCTNGLMAWKVEEGAIRRRHVNMPTAELQGMMEESMRLGIDNGRKLLDGMVQSTKFTLDNPFSFIEEQGKSVNMSKKQIDVVKSNFEIEPMNSLYGVVNAFTRTARDQKNHDSRLILEKLAGNMLALA